MEKENVDNEVYVLYTLKLIRRHTPNIVSTVAIARDVKTLIDYYNTNREDWTHHSGATLHFKPSTLLTHCIPLDNEEVLNIFKTDSGVGISGIRFNSKESMEMFLNTDHPKKGLIINSIISDKKDEE